MLNHKEVVVRTVASRSGSESSLGSGHWAQPIEELLPRGPAAGAAEELLAHTASLLTGRVAGLTERALVRVRGEVPFYANPLLSPPDLDSSAHTALEIAVGSRSERERFTDSGEFAWQIGGRRARQGVPLRMLLQAQEIGACVLWESLVEQVMREAPEKAALMAQASTRFWQHVNRDNTLLTEAHRLGSGAPDRKSHRRLYPLLRVILRGGLDPVRASGLAVAVDLPLHGRYAVVVLAGPGASKLTDVEECAGIRMRWCPHRRGMAGIALLGERSPADLAAALPVDSDVRGGISPVVAGLVELGRARERAELALDTCTSGQELALMDDRLCAAYAASRPDLAAELQEKVLGPLLRLEEKEKVALLDTLAAWLDCGGSPTQAGVRLYCHRNTVMNRLHRLERLTGRSLDRPRDVVELALALDAFRLGCGPAA